ncbi:RagB/SusD family nutrient uptake outer membrane protein [Robertkochia sediminum]|uniref:RagB/SusD family nutrient uptake outer membrane protein n=1 Tax=Robertkochia sediminum TaxID=2785326 RepID=UPI00193281FC|nr:RagB/SusD family nutrient uptake outer membrane protein [Robertkochia sediminum]MBL7472819.1 RagB/SusD family nutrient uptake outer membrane protein [Robertkochia sediminum]
MKPLFKYYYLTIVALTGLTSCDDNLDLVPEQSLDPETATSSPANIQNLLIGAYDLAGSNVLFSGDTQLASELLANDNRIENENLLGELAWRGTFQGPAEFNRKQMTAQNAFVVPYWTQGYATINQTNLVLDNLDIITDPETAAILEGEAKFLRALVYFELVRHFGLPYETGQTNAQLGVPIVTNAVTDASQIEFPSRNSVEEVYTQLITDLQDAYNLLPDENSFFADRYAAQAILARIYLQQGNYVAARDAADDVLNNSGHSLTASYEDAFNNDEDSTEDIFAWQITTQDGINDYNTFWATRDFGGRSLTGDITIEAPYFELFDDPNDERSTFFYEGNGTLASGKWQSQFANVPFLRLAEMHLIRAECNFREGSNIGLSPLEEINALRARSNASALGALDLEEILRERKRELGFEGFALHDLKRTKQDVAGIPYNADELVMPIPQREIDANPNLVQNPGYVN